MTKIVVIIAKEYLKLSNLHIYATKTKESITFPKLGSRDIWQIANSVLNKSKSDIPPLFNRTEVLPSAFDKTKY